MGIDNAPFGNDSTSSHHFPLRDACPDRWTWNALDKSPDVTLLSERNQVVHFHPNWSNGTAGVRGSHPLGHNGVQYWEITVTRRLFGTSMMFGIARQQACLHVDAFVNLLGKDELSWALSHKGLVWHRGKCRQYTAPFKENETTIIGVLFDGCRGTLSYYRDGVNLGEAFTGLTNDGEPLYPAVCSTAAKTEMILGRTLRSFNSLQDRCRAVIGRALRAPGDVEGLPLPGELKRYVSESLSCGDAPRGGGKQKVRQLHGVGLPLFRRRAQQQLVY